METGNNPKATQKAKDNLCKIHSAKRRTINSAIHIRSHACMNTPPPKILAKRESKS